MNKLRKSDRKISIHTKVLLWLVAAILLQGILYIGILTVNGGFKYLEETAEGRMADAVGIRSGQLESDMLYNWSNISDYVYRINREVADTLAAREKSVQDMKSDDLLSQEIVRNVSGTLVEMLRQTETNEAFMILCGTGGREEEQVLSGFHIRDLDPSVNLGGEDLLLETGSAEIAGSMGITLDSLWESRFNAASLPSFYSKVIANARTYSNYGSENLGYWSESFQWRDKDWPLISYSVPLMDGEGDVYGIVGVSVSEDYLKSLMPVKELDPEGLAAYILMKSKNNGRQAMPVVTSGIFRADVLHPDGTVDMPENYNTVYQIKDSNLYSTAKAINLYKRSSPYYGEKWYLQSIVPKDILYENADHLRIMMSMAFLISIGIGGVIAVFASFYLTRPISKLVWDIRQQEINSKFENVPSGIREIDELKDAIAVMDGRIRDNTSRLSKIIKLVNLPLGAIEYSAEDKLVYCTAQVISVLHMKPSAYKNGAVSREYFEKFWRDAGLEQFLTENGEMEYQIRRDGCTYWIHVESWVEKEKVFIIVMDQTEDIVRRQRLEYERDYDTLTNLLSRRAFDRKVTEILEAEGDMALGAMIMWDLDNLKYVNDTYGHDAGDKYIQKAAKIFGSLVREHPRAVIGRISGDEFLAFIPDCREKEEVINTLGIIRNRLHSEKLLVADGESLALRASGGVAWYPMDGASLESLKKCADFAMYDTKTSSKGFYKQYSQKNYDKNSLLFRGQEELNKIIEDKQVEYYFQPIVSTTDGSVFAYEALMRPKTKTLQTASDVMRLAADQFRLGEVELLTFEMAFYFYKLQEEAFGSAKLFINSIPNQLINEEIFDMIYAQYPECKGRVVVEITEGEHAEAETLRKKQSFNEKYEWEIALDDFGSGYSTEESLLYLQPQYVKIDMVLIQGIGKDEDKQSLVKNLLSYARPRNIRVIAEGVEEWEDMEMVIRLGVDYVQGDYLGAANSRPVDIPEDKVRRILSVRERKEDKS